jgi:hypothetical protein
MEFANDIGILGECGRGHFRLSPQYPEMPDPVGRGGRDKHADYPARATTLFDDIYRNALHISHRMVGPCATEAS